MFSQQNWMSVYHTVLLWLQSGMMMCVTVSSHMQSMCMWGHAPVPRIWTILIIKCVFPTRMQRQRRGWREEGWVVWGVLGPMSWRREGNSWERQLGTCWDAQHVLACLALTHTQPSVVVSRGVVIGESWGVISHFHPSSSYSGAPGMFYVVMQSRLFEELHALSNYL